MTPEQLAALRETRAELSTIRGNLRREYADLWNLACDAAAEPQPDDGTMPALNYATWNTKLADRALTTALQSLAHALGEETGR